MAIFGWADPKMAALYNRRANRKRLAVDAAHLMVPEETENETVPLSSSVENRGTSTPKNPRKSNAI